MTPALPKLKLSSGTTLLDSYAASSIQHKLPHKLPRLALTGGVFARNGPVGFSSAKVGA
jgi:hypothetical protein